MAWRAVLPPVLAMVVVLSLFSNGYGYHRDELYFRMLDLRWGYVDQPPLTPLLAHVFGTLSDNPWAIRIPATLAAAGSVLVLVLITRELGGTAAAQGLCAWGYAFAAVPLIFGHVLLTSTLDLPVWSAVLLFVLRAQLRAQPRWWLAAGAVVGLSLYNKLLIAVLLVALALGLLAVGPRRLLLSRWILGAVGLIVLLGLPNLIYQVVNGLPQLRMGRALAEHNGSSSRVFMWPFLLLMLGPPLVPIWLAGLVALWRRPAVRFVAISFPVLLILVCVMGAQFYYPVGLVSVLFAAGCVPTAAWFAARPARRAWVTAGVALNAAVSLVLGLPLIPLSVVGKTPIPGINQTARDTVGWPTYVNQVASGLRRPSRRRQGPRRNWWPAITARPAPWIATAPACRGVQRTERAVRPRPPVRVGGDRGRRAGAAGPVLVRLLHRRRSPDNGRDVDNEEQGEPISVCREPIGGWASVWPRFKHLD